MSYSAFFTAGLTLASHPRDYESSSFAGLPSLPLQINVPPPRRMRKRRSSLTIATSPITTIKMSSGRTATDTVKSVLRSPSPRDATFFEALQAVARPKMMRFVFSITLAHGVLIVICLRRLTVSNVKDLPSRPAPTAPLPTLPNHMTRHASSVPKTPTEEAYPSSPITSDPPAQYGSLRAIPSRRSSFLLPLENAYGGNIPIYDTKKDLFMEMKDVPGAEDEEDKKENGVEL